MRELRIAVIVLAAGIALTLVGGAFLYVKAVDTADDVERQAVALERQQDAHCQALDNIHKSLVAFVREHHGITVDLREVGVFHEQVPLREALEPLRVECAKRGGFSRNQPEHDHSDHRGNQRGSQGGDRSQTGSTSPPSSQPGPPSGGSPGDGGGSPPDDGGAPSPPGGSPPSPPAPNPPSPGPGPSPPSPPPNPPQQQQGGLLDTVDETVDGTTDAVCDLSGGLGVNVPGVCP